MNIFGTVLTYAAPSSNYRGESEANRTVLQKVTRNGKEYTVISPESMRNALREMLSVRGLECNRQRLHDEDQLAVEFKDYPNAEKYADDFLFGYMVADKEAVAVLKKEKRPAKRDSVLRMNLAVALTPYRFDATFHQSPMNAGKSPWKNSSSSALLHREIALTAYQYPFALSVVDCSQNEKTKSWSATMLECIGELSGVAGGHARSLFEMAPRSIVIRVTPSLVAGFDSYGFDESGGFPELSRLKEGDLPGHEFWLGGELIRNSSKEQLEHYKTLKVRTFENPQILLKELAQHLLGAKVGAR